MLDKTNFFQQFRGVSTMRKTISLSVASALFTILLTVSGMAKDPDKTIQVAGFDTLYSVIDPGMIICVNGQFTGDLGNPCTGGTTRVHIKDQVVQMAYFGITPPTAEPLFDGLNTMTVDCNLDADLNGRCWGKFEWPLSTGGTWNGVIHSEQSFSTWDWKIELVGTGNGGPIEGMQLEYCSSAPPWEFVGTFVSRIHNPKAGNR
jgi:hypothetical protein